MEIILAIIGSLTVLVGAIAGLLAGVNYLIRESSLFANSIWELKKYKFKRHKKDGTHGIID